MPAAQAADGAPAAEVAVTSAGVVIVEVEQVVILLDDGSYAREIQWVIIRNEGQDTVNLKGWNVSSHEGETFAAGGLDLVRGSYELPYGFTAIIVTSPYVELDRGEPVRHRHVLTAIDTSSRFNESRRDFEEVRLEDDRRAIVDWNTPECIGGCCCTNIPPACTTGSNCAEMCEDDCGNNCVSSCLKWQVGDCPLACANPCCQ